MRVTSVYLKRFAQFSGQILNKLPGDATGSGTTGYGPFNGHGAPGILFDRQVIGLHIAPDHFEIGILIAGMEAQP